VAFKARLYILLFTLIFTASVSQILSQYRIFSRNNPAIPPAILNNLQNEHRKLINLNGDWNILSSDPVINTTINVPFCYEFKGKINTRRDFNLGLDNPNEWNYVIHAEGINYQCEISINGKFVIKHEGGFTPFSSPIADGVIKGNSNSIEIRIDNTLDPSRTIPLKNTANYPKNYGGIYRDIYILAVPKIYVKSVNVFSEIDINLNADIKNQVTLSATDIARYQADEKKLNIKTELFDTSGNLKGSSDAVPFTIAGNSTVQAENKFTLTSPVFWSPENPFCYKLRVIVSAGTEIIDVFQTDFGIYELTKKSGTIVFNRNEFRFKGLNYVEEFNNGLCANYEDVERDLKNLKSLGCNIIKIYGRPASDYLVDLCNKYGLLIMEEIPVHTVPESILESETFLSLAENQFIEMVAAHKNNPCIFAYGLGNDFDVSGDAGRNYIKKLSDVAKKLDNRILYYSTRNYYEDNCRDLVDLTGFNYYDNDPQQLKSIINNLKLKKDKIFISNYGKIINPANLSGYSDPNSLEAQSKFIVDFYKLYKSSPFAGAFFESYTDWNSDIPNLKHYDLPNQYMRTTGLYTIFREQRPPAVIMRKHFLEEDIPNLNIGTFTKEAPLVYVFVGLISFILFVYLANSVRRFRENVNRALFRPFIFFTDVREQNLIPALHNILLALIISAGNALFFSNLIYYWKDSQLLDIMLTVLSPNDNIKIILDSAFVSPVKLLLLLTSVVFVKIFIISLIIWLFSLTIKYRIGFGNIYTITVWGFLPTILLLAAGTFYIRILNFNSDFVLIGLGLAVLLYIISIYRILKGTYVIFDVYFIKVYTYGIITIAVIGGSLWYYLNTSRFFFDYLKLVMLFLKG
jgi:beta-galactosidase